MKYILIKSNRCDDTHHLLPNTLNGQAGSTINNPKYCVLTTNINEAYVAAAKYNEDFICGCRAEVGEST